MTRLGKSLEARLIGERVIGASLLGGVCGGLMARLNHADGLENCPAARRIQSNSAGQIALFWVSIVALDADDPAGIYGRVVYPMQGTTELLVPGEHGSEGCHNAPIIGESA